MSTTIRCRQIAMLVVDLHQHSTPSIAMASGLVMEAKIELANGLEHHLRSKGLRRLNWAGDGGIFWIECTKVADFDAVVLSGELAFRVLHSVNAFYADQFPDDYKMALRVSGHFGPLLTVPQPGLWHGNDLNFIAKHEREVSAPGMFAITKQLRSMLSQEHFIKFPESRSITKEIVGDPIVIYFHERYGELAGRESELQINTSR